MADGLTMILGGTGAWNVTGKGVRNAAITAFTDADALDAKVWPGGAQPTTLTPTVTWADSATCVVRLLITPAQQAAATTLAAGAYHVEIGATPASDGLRRVLYYDTVRFRPTAGADAAPVAWVTYDDLANWSGQISALQDRDEDQTGFARQRERATQEAIDYLVSRYSPVPGQSRRYTDAGRTGSGPHLVYAGAPDGSDPPSRPQVAAWLADPRRVVMAGDLRKAVSLIAAAMVYGTNPGTSNPYAQQAAADQTEGEARLAKAYVEVDTKTVPDGVPTVRLSRNIIYLT